MSDGATRKDECKRLHAQTLQVLKEEHDVEQQVQELQKKIRKLRRKGKVLSDDAVEKKKTATQALESYAKVACRELCEEIYNVFPREVRDMIYGCLHYQREINIITDPSGWGNHTYFLSINEAQWHGHDSWGSTEPTADHWWRVECTGENFRREMSEQYYRSALFNFSDSFSILARFRCTDQWKVGFLPADIVMNIEVDVLCHHYDFDGLEPVPDGWGSTPNWNCERKDTSQLLTELEQIFGFAKGTKVTVRITVGPHKKKTALRSQEWMCDTVLPFIMPTLRRLASSGLDIRIVLQAPAPGAKDISRDFVFRRNQCLETDAKKAFIKFKNKVLKEQEEKEDATEAIVQSSQDASEESGEDEDESSESSEEDEEDEEEEDEG